jgi:hypothetical protein
VILGHARRRIALIVLLLSLLVPSTVTAQSQAPVAAVRGQTATLPPEGRWLLLGGEGVAGPVGTAEIRDPSDGSVVHLATGLAMPRAWHTATVLSDGSVLVLGGIGPAGSPFAAPELFDRESQTFHPITIAGLTPRAQHTATLLTDGTILVAGGLSAAGDVRDDAELIDLHDGPAATATGPMTRERQGHDAWLRPDGGALLWGGLDRQGLPRPDGDLFDPERERFGFTTVPPLASIDPPALVGSLPQDGATDVSTSGLIALRFSKPVRVDTVTPLTVFLTGPRGLEPTQVVAAEGGALAFVTPRTLLETGSTYTVSINGVRDDAGVLVPATAVQFTTAGPPPAAMNPTAIAGSQTAPHDHGQGSDDEHGHRARVSPRRGGGEVDDPVWRGPMKDDKPYSQWQDLPALRAPDGVTALSGQVLRLNGQPLGDVTLSIGPIEARTDHTGRFLLRGLPAGRQVLVMDASTANRPGRTYGTFVYGLPISAGQTTVLPFTIWMPLLDMAHAVELPVPTTQDMVITTPRVPGLEMHIPGGVTLQLADGPLTVISLTRIPVDRTPFPLPPGTTFFYTPQGHGAQVQLPDGTPSPRGVSFLLPNLDQLSPSSRVALQTSTPSRGWYVYGYGTVSADGQQILPDPGLEMHRVLCASGLGGSVQFAGPVPGGLRATDPVDLATRLFTYEKTDLVLPDVIPIVLRRSHRGGDAGKRTFGVGAADDYSLYLVGDYSTYQWAELMLPDGGRVRFSRISSGTDKAGAVFEHTATPTRWYKARLAYNSARPGFDLTLTTQWRYEFGPFNAFRCPGNRSRPSRIRTATG